MIYTITFNPALDYISKVDNFEIGKINRTKEEKILPGGKGLNVSTVLKNLGFQSTALGFIAGFTGKELKTEIEKYGIQTDFIEVKEGITRINVKISSDVETALNGNGPIITEADIEKLLEQISKFNNEDIVILAGNIPKGIKNNIYEIICSKLEKNGVTFVVDSTKELLINVLKYKPFLIKPNHHELGEMFNVELKNKEEIIIYAKKLQEIGARNVIISMAGDGAILIEENGEITISDTPKGTLVNSVGAGDSMVGGFLAGIAEDKNIKEAFKMGVATGSASAFSEGLATKDKVEELLKQL